MESNYINKTPDRSSSVYHLSQNDNGRTIRCCLHDGSIVETLNGSENIVIHYKKPNGEIGILPVTNTESTYVDIDIPNTMTDKSGKVYCKLRIDGIGYKSLYLDVEEKP